VSFKSTVAGLNTTSGPRTLSFNSGRIIVSTSTLRPTPVTRCEPFFPDSLTKPEKSLAKRISVRVAHTKANLASSMGIVKRNGLETKLVQQQSLSIESECKRADVVKANSWRERTRAPPQKELAAEDQREGLD